MFIHSSLVVNCWGNKVSLPSWYVRNSKVSPEYLMSIRKCMKINWIHRKGFPLFLVARVYTCTLLSFIPFDFFYFFAPENFYFFYSQYSKNHENGKILSNKEKSFDMYIAYINIFLSFLFFATWLTYRVADFQHLLERWCVCS